MEPPTRIEKWLSRLVWVFAVLSGAVCLLLAGGAVTLLIGRLGP